MTISALLVAILTFEISLSGQSPRLPNFCQLKCGQIENSACDCTIKGRHSEDVADLRRFRKTILNKFNDIRSAVASGREKSERLGQASNMNVLSYDIELEYVARCYAVKYVFYHDKCRKTSKFSKPGQIILRFEEEKSFGEITEHVDELFKTELEEISNKTIASYDGGNLLDINAFAQILWWSQTHVGCARVHNPKAILKYDTYVVICNFGGLKESNVAGEPVYRRGEPCSECDENKKCNEVYKKLCGTFEKPPNDTALYAINSGEFTKGTQFVAVFGLLFCLI